MIGADIDQAYHSSMFQTDNKEGFENNLKISAKNVSDFRSKLASVRNHKTEANSGKLSPSNIWLLLNADSKSLYIKLKEQSRDSSITPSRANSKLSKRAHHQFSINTESKSTYLQSRKNSSSLLNYSNERYDILQRLRISTSLGKSPANMIRAVSFIFF